MAITRRRFVGGGLATGAALMGGAVSPFSRLGAAPKELASWIEATIPELQGLMSAGALTSRALTAGYLNRIAALNPLLGAVIETNPNAIAIAVQRDRERRSGNVRGPLHGIPILLKDNIATADNMQTTAGSLALVNSRVPGRCADRQPAARSGRGHSRQGEPVRVGQLPRLRAVQRLERPGRLHARSLSARLRPCGSSSGSAVAPAANLCAAAVGTETDGSIVCPAGNNLVVGLKPTLGLLSQDGIIPIAHSQDTAGPMARTVTDVAILLGVMQTPFGEVARPSAAAATTRGSCSAAR